MLFFAVPLYFIAFIGWIIYAGLIKKNLKENMPMFYFGSVFSVIWVVIILVSL